MEEGTGGNCHQIDNVNPKCCTPTPILKACLKVNIQLEIGPFTINAIDKIKLQDNLISLLNISLRYTLLYL